MQIAGIIGGGIGGTSCALFLKTLFGETEIEIDLYEAEKVGGRLSAVEFSKNQYEEGGSIIHDRNKYMSGFLKKFNFNKRHSTEGYFGLYDGKQFIFAESDWQIKTLWNVIYRYGFGFWKLKNEIDDMLNKFDRIYDLQNLGEAFDTVEALLAAIDPKFVDYLNVSTKHGFEKDGISNMIINEIIMATIRANYGQNVNIPKMVGSVSIAGAFGDLWAVKGGNFKIPQYLLKESRANLILRTVSVVKRLGSEEIQISSKTSDSALEEIETYDIVVVAAPQTSDAQHLIEFKDFREKIKFHGRYHTTVCTLVEGNLAEEYFPKQNPQIDEILTVKDEIFFNSIGRITPVDYSPNGETNKSNVWKVFTQKRMKNKDISLLFSDVSNKYEKKWLAYPHYESQVPLKNNSFILATNLYHINAIEWVASAMEMSVIGAKNVALLIYKNLLSKPGQEDIGALVDSINQKGEEL
ncbi:hypothetical protein RUM44_005547 [Polyplax serrata]|uniref:Prenylcysteine lyase domain-containing protein n=1 Tax=Polyplax serrata TaxID=468196 RepID=A0ABR1AE48_POLSC